MWIFFQNILFDFDKLFVVPGTDYSDCKANYPVSFYSFQLSASFQYSVSKDSWYSAVFWPVICLSLGRTCCFVLHSFWYKLPCYLCHEISVVNSTQSLSISQTGNLLLFLMKSWWNASLCLRVGRWRQDYILSFGFTVALQGLGESCLL